MNDRSRSSSFVARKGPKDPRTAPESLDPQQDRRCSSRMPVEMWVEQATDREIYFQRSANISSGGIYLEHTVPLPRGTVITLRFTLPDAPKATEVRGEIVNVGESVTELGMGVKFVDLPPETRQRISSFIQRALDEDGQ